MDENTKKRRTKNILKPLYFNKNLLKNHDLSTGYLPISRLVLILERFLQKSISEKAKQFGVTIVYYPYL
jgi:hypothetical protein